MKLPNAMRQLTAGNHFSIVTPLIEDRIRRNRLGRGEYTFWHVHELGASSMNTRIPVKFIIAGWLSPVPVGGGRWEWDRVSVSADGIALE
jgi:hypothetical protein